MSEEARLCPECAEEVGAGEAECSRCAAGTEGPVGAGHGAVPSSPPQPATAQQGRLGRLRRTTVWVFWPLMLVAGILGATNVRAAAYAAEQDPSLGAQAAWGLLALTGLALWARDLRSPGRQRLGCSCDAALAGTLGLVVVGSIAIPNLHHGGCGGCETSAIGFLQTVAKAQDRFRSEDWDGDGRANYGRLDQLSSEGRDLPFHLNEHVLSTGTMSGFVFAVAPSKEHEDRWFATAHPHPVHRPRYHRRFCINQSGVVFYTTAGRIPLDEVDCAIPAGVKPLGE